MTLDVEKFAEVSRRFTPQHVHDPEDIPCRLGRSKSEPCRKPCKRHGAQPWISLNLYLGLTETGLRSSDDASKRVWQTLPRHLRRRTASHDPRRVPVRLREKALSEVGLSLSSVFSGFTNVLLDGSGQAEETDQGTEKARQNLRHWKD